MGGLFNGSMRKNTINVNDFMNNNYRRKIIPMNMIYEKEDLYD
jgi:hypothetical protein